MEVEVLDAESKGFNRAVKDCVAGTFGGIVQVLVGQVKLPALVLTYLKIGSKD